MKKFFRSARFCEQASKPFTVYAPFMVEYDPDLDLTIGVSDAEIEAARVWFDNELRARGITPTPWVPPEPCPSSFLQPYLDEIIRKVDAIPPSTEPGADIEVGIYGKKDVRVWRVFRGI